MVSVIVPSYSLFYKRKIKMYINLCIMNILGIFVHKVKVKVKFTLCEAMKAQRGGIFIPVLFL